MSALSRDQSVIWPPEEALLKDAVTGIAAVTVASGLIQMLLPGLILKVVDGPQTRATRHLFGIVGMFMTVVGGLLLQDQMGEPDERSLLWGGVQKVGASLGVGLGVARGIFAPRALLVAGFDMASAGVIFWYRREIARR